jgi:hypothetical protein
MQIPSMKRLRRWIFHSMVTVSPLLVIFSTSLWVLSYSKPWRANILASGEVDPFSWTNERGDLGWNVLSESGQLDIRPFYWFLEWHIFYWELVLLGTILPIYRLSFPILYRRERRIADKRCVNCGYDLRATPERCPECGMITAGVSNDAAIARDKAKLR